MAAGCVRRNGEPADVGAGIAVDGLSQTFRPPAPLHPGCRSARGVQKKFPAELAAIQQRIGAGIEVEIWFQDEARVGQKNKADPSVGQTRYARPRAPHHQRTISGYIVGAICPAKGKGAGLVMPWCDTPAMQAHLHEISAAVAPGAHAVIILDQAGWHMSARLEVPGNITLLPLPPRSPELNPQENVWQFLRDNWLSNRIFSSYDDIVDHCCKAWNRLTGQPWRIMSIGLRDWAYGF
jgi:DDE superfamily endonuclease